AGSPGTARLADAEGEGAGRLALRGLGPDVVRDGDVTRAYEDGATTGVRPRRSGVGLSVGRRETRGQRFVAAATGVGKPAVVITQCREAVEIDGKLVPLGECPAHVVGEGHHVIHREAAARGEGEHVAGADPWMTAVKIGRASCRDRVERE